MVYERRHVVGVQLILQLVDDALKQFNNIDTLILINRINILFIYFMVLLLNIRYIIDR